MRSAGEIKGDLVRRLYDKGGMSISELLLCILIMTLCGGLMTKTLGLGIRQFRDRSRDSDAEILCNTLASSVQMKLACASQVAPVTASGGEYILGAFSTGADELDVATTISDSNDIHREIQCEFTTQRVYYDDKGKRHVADDQVHDGSGTREIVIQYHVNGRDDEEGTIVYPLASYYAHGSTGRFHAALASFCEVTYTMDEAGKNVKQFHVSITVSADDDTTLASRTFVVTPIMTVPVKAF